MTVEMLYKYYGVDWVAMIFTMLAIIQLGNKQKNGFILMMIGNTAWIFFGLVSLSAATIVANIIFLGLNLRGLLRWSKNEA